MLYEVITNPSNVCPLLSFNSRMRLIGKSPFGILNNEIAKIKYNTFLRSARMECRTCRAMRVTALRPSAGCDRMAHVITKNRLKSVLYPDLALRRLHKINTEAMET